MSRPIASSRPISKNNRPTALSETRTAMIAPVVANAIANVANDRPPNPDHRSSVSVRFQLMANSTTLPITAVTLIAQTTATTNRARGVICLHSPRKAVVTPSAPARTFA
jgi:hypothetical protein